MITRRTIAAVALCLLTALCLTSNQDNYQRISAGEEPPEGSNRPEDSEAPKGHADPGIEKESPKEWLEHLTEGLRADNEPNSEKAADIRSKAALATTLCDIRFTLENWDTLVPKDLQGYVAMALSDEAFNYTWPTGGWGDLPPSPSVLLPRLFPSETRQVLPQLRALFIKLDGSSEGTGGICWPTEPVTGVRRFVMVYASVLGRLPDTLEHLRTRFGSDLTEGLFTQEELSAAIKSENENHPLRNTLPHLRKRWHFAQEFMYKYSVCKDPLADYAPSDELTKKVEELIAKLGSDSKETVSESRKSLADIGLEAYSLLQKAAKEGGKPISDEAASLLNTWPFLVVTVAKQASEKYECNRDILLLEMIAIYKPDLKDAALKRLAQICPDALGNAQKWTRYEYTEWYKKYAHYAVWDNDAQRWKIHEGAIKAEIPLEIWDSIPWPESAKSDKDRVAYWEKLTAYEKEGLTEWAWFKKYEKENQAKLKRIFRFAKPDDSLYCWFLLPRDDRAHWNKFDVKAKFRMARDAESLLDKLKDSKEGIKNLLDAIQHGIDYALWMQMPEDTRKKWDSLTCKQKQKLLAEAEKKLLEESGNGQQAAGNGEGTEENKAKSGQTEPSE
ncbi:MAG: hypothetical protein ABIH04_09505 [Planctomycetota bacterium]